eukprot:1356615-Pyramimonas_sp.AAC.1
MAKVFRKLEKGNGFEMWRKTCARYDPKDRNTRRGLMTAILSYDFSTDRLDSLPEKLAEFEVLVQQYDDLANPEECSDDVKITAVIQSIPEPMKGHFELNTELYDTYEELKQKILAYVQGKRDWKNPFAKSGSDSRMKPMEVDPLTS